MSKLTKNEIANCIRNLIPYIENPMILAPKGCFKEHLEATAGKIIEYDSSLMPQTPKVIEMSEALKILVDLYKECE
jgi:hypothetical protein